MPETILEASAHKLRMYDPKDEVMSEDELLFVIGTKV